MEYGLDNLAKDAISSITKPVSDKLNAQIDKVATLTKKKLAAQKGVSESKITDLQVAEYIANLPTQKMTEEIGDKMVYIGDVTRNGLIIGLGLIAIAVLVVGLKRKSA